MRFHATLIQERKTATGIEIPPEVLEALGGGKRPAVTVTVNGFSYRTSVGSMGGRSLVPVSAERRAAAGLTAGDEIDVDLELDDAPREVVVPDALAEAFAQHPEAKAAFDKLSFSGQSRYTLPVADAKTAETRERRVAKAIEELGAA